MDNEELEFIEFLQDAKHTLSEDNVDQTPEDVERLINENKSAIQKRVEAQRQRELLEQQQYLQERQQLQEERERFECERFEFDKKKLLFEQEKLTQERVEFELDRQTQAYDPASVVEQALQFKQLHADLREIGVPVNNLNADGFDSLNEQDRDHVLKIYQHLVHEIAKRTGDITIDQVQQLIDDAYGSTNIQNTAVYSEYLKLADSVNTSKQPVDQDNDQSEPDETIDEPSNQDKTRAETLKEFRKGEYDYDAYRKRMQKHEDELQELYLAEDEQFGLLNENDAYQPADSQFFNELQAARESELEDGGGSDEDGDSDKSDDYRRSKMFPEAGDPGVPVPDIAPPPIDDFPDAPVPFPPPPPGLPPMFPPPSSTPTKSGGTAVATYDDPGGTGTGTQTVTGFDEPPRHVIKCYPEGDPTNTKKSIVKDDGSWGPETWDDIPVPRDILTETITPSGSSTTPVAVTSTTVIPPVSTPTGGRATATYVDDGTGPVVETTSGDDENPRDVIIVHLETDPTNKRKTVVNDDRTWGPVNWIDDDDFPGGSASPRDVIVTVVAPSADVTDTVLIIPTTTGETDTTTTGGTVSATSTPPVDDTVVVTLTGTSETPGIIVDTYVSTVPDTRKSVVVDDDGSWGPVEWPDVDDGSTVKIDISNQSDDLSTPVQVVPTVHLPPASIPGVPDSKVSSTFTDPDGDETGTTVLSGTAPPGDVVDTYRATDPTGHRKSIVVDDDGSWGPLEWPDGPGTDILVSVTPTTTESVGPNIVVPTGAVSFPDQIIDERQSEIGHAANWIRVSEYEQHGDFPDLNGYYAPIKAYDLAVYKHILNNFIPGESYIPRFIRVYDGNGDLVLDPDNLQDAITLVHYIAPESKDSMWCMIQGYIDGTETHGFPRYPATGANLLYSWPPKGHIAICRPRPTSLCGGDIQIILAGKKVCPEEICMVDPYTGEETCLLVHYDTSGVNNRRWFSAGTDPRLWRTTDHNGNYVYFSQDADGNMTEVTDQQTKDIINDQLDGVDNNSSVTPWNMLHMYGGDNPRYPIDTPNFAPTSNFPFQENFYRSDQVFVPWRRDTYSLYNPLNINPQHQYPVVSSETVNYIADNVIMQSYPRHVGPERNKDGKLLNRRHFVIDIGMPRRVLEGTKMIEWSSDPRMFLSDSELFTAHDGTQGRTFGAPEYRRSDYYGCGSAPTDEQGNVLGGPLIRQSCSQLKDTWIDDSIDRLSFNMARTRYWWSSGGSLPNTMTMIERAEEFLELLDVGDKYMEGVTGLHKVVEFYPDDQMTTPYRYEDWLDDLPPETDPWWTDPNRDFTLEYEIDPLTSKKTPLPTFFIGDSSRLSDPV